jgi:hypothetical protein
MGETGFFDVTTPSERSVLLDLSDSGPVAEVDAPI